MSRNFYFVVNRLEFLADSAAPVKLVKNIFKGVSGLLGEAENEASKIGSGILGSTGAAAQSLIPKPSDIGSKLVGDITPKPGQKSGSTGIPVPQVGLSSQLGSFATSMSAITAELAAVIYFKL